MRPTIRVQGCSTANVATFLILLASCNASHGNIISVFVSDKSESSGWKLISSSTNQRCWSVQSHGVVRFKYKYLYLSVLFSISGAGCSSTPVYWHELRKCFWWSELLARLFNTCNSSSYNTTTNSSYNNYFDYIPPTTNSNHKLPLTNFYN